MRSLLLLLFGIGLALWLIVKFIPEDKCESSIEGFKENAGKEIFLETKGCNIFVNSYRIHLRSSDESNDQVVLESGGPILEYRWDDSRHISIKTNADIFFRTNSAQGVSITVQSK